MMIVSFTIEAEPPSVETVTAKEEEASDVEDNAASVAESEISMSEYGPAAALPRWCLFGPKECQCIFEISSDKGAFSQVCGRAVATCTARHSLIGEKAEVGYYEPIKARKYCGGKFHTFLSMNDYAAMEQIYQEAKTLELEQASAFFSDLGGSPTGSEEGEYAHFQGDFNVMKSFNQQSAAEKKPSMADPLVSRELKAPPNYNKGGDVKPSITPRPSKKTPQLQQGREC
jgi:hypothetical protein